MLGEASIVNILPPSANLLPYQFHILSSGNQLYQPTDKAPERYHCLIGSLKPSFKGNLRTNSSRAPYREVGPELLQLGDVKLWKLLQSTKEQGASLAST
ncbi:hypothetical protein VNO78_10679 [Psophocarpus tetragonolobus]|uniref:Uncharacterized protein n=1 Tax=Psophocarpus tetragonolobus TaxID=3891 RepID=A0AAN9SMI5_PSOTE